MKNCLSHKVPQGPGSSDPQLIMIHTLGFSLSSLFWVVGRWCSWLCLSVICIPMMYPPYMQVCRIGICSNMFDVLLYSCGVLPIPLALSEVKHPHHHQQKRSLRRSVLFVVFSSFCPFSRSVSPIPLHFLQAKPQPKEPETPKPQKSQPWTLGTKKCWPKGSRDHNANSI